MNINTTQPVIHGLLTRNLMFCPQIFPSELFFSSHYAYNGSNTMWLGPVQCAGTEESILDCLHEGIGQIPGVCLPEDILGIVCDGKYVN